MRNQIRRYTKPLPRKLRSKVTNGKSLFVSGSGGDGRGAYARRLRDTIDAHTEDLGGHDNCSQAELSIIRRIATLTVELERIEAKFTVGEGDALLDIYQRTAGNLRRLLESIGLQRRSREVQTLEQYVAANYGERADRAERASERSGVDPAPSLAAVSETAMPGLARAAERPSRSGSRSW
jgi:hypothetical protein